jgi:hypothetical protein
MKIDDRKAAIAACKKRKTAAGIYAVRCAPTGQTWVGQTLNLETIQNRIWFSCAPAAIPTGSCRAHGRRTAPKPSASSRLSS